MQGTKRNNHYYHLPLLCLCSVCACKPPRGLSSVRIVCQQHQGPSSWQKSRSLQRHQSALRLSAGFVVPTGGQLKVQKRYVNNRVSLQANLATAAKPQSQGRLWIKCFWPCLQGHSCEERGHYSAEGNWDPGPPLERKEIRRAAAERERERLFEEERKEAEKVREGYNYIFKTCVYIKTIHRNTLHE